MKQRETQKYQNSVLRWANKQVCGTCSSEKPQHYLKHVQTWKIKQFGPAIVMVVTDQMQHISRKKKAENSHWVDFNMKLSPVYNLSAFCTHPSITKDISRKYFLVMSQNRTAKNKHLASWKGQVYTSLCCRSLNKYLGITYPRKMFMGACNETKFNFGSQKFCVLMIPIFIQMCVCTHISRDTRCHNMELPLHSHFPEYHSSDYEMNLCKRWEGYTCQALPEKHTTWSPFPPSKLKHLQYNYLTQCKDYRSNRVQELVCKWIFEQQNKQRNPHVIATLQISW